MEPGQFLSALMAIVVIDIVLAGDNAIVIALAARQLPQRLQKRAIVWGALGAVAVRIVLTAAVVWLLKVPGLLAIGGALLVWIAWKLLQPDEAQQVDTGSDAHPSRPAAHAMPAATTFWGAMRTVIVADALMGLDNVLAVAGAAHGSLLLVALGLAISVPIVMWGSTLVLKVVERFPVVVYVGAGVLVWTAVTMMLSEPLLKAWLAEQHVPRALPFALVPLLLVAAFVRNHRQLESRIHARLRAMSDVAPQPAPPTVPGGPPMLNVLVPIDGSANSLTALRHAIAEYRRDHDLKLHLLHVQPRLSRHISRFVSRGDREAWHHERADAALAGARELLRQAEVPFEEQWCIGDRAEEICRAAQELNCHHIVIGTARKNSLTRMLEDSVTGKVLETATVPVEVVVGREVSRLERWGVPTGIGLSLGGLVLAVLAD
ncbi:MAG: YjbE family putative metal transport protein [Nitrospira sp.]|nr:YjbE family putative metal transport protein [Nitrospira sp.]